MKQESFQTEALLNITVGGGMMTIDEASERYQIPMEVLKEYESWGLCGAVM